MVALPAYRARLCPAHFSSAIDNPADYDLVINTAQVPLIEAVDLVAAHMHAHACNKDSGTGCLAGGLLLGQEKARNV